MAEKSEQLMGKEELDALWAKIKNTFFASASFTQANIQSTLGISNWALASSKPSYAFSEITGTASSSQIPTLAISKIDGLQTALNNKLETSLKGAAYGLAELDANGLVPASQLPSYVDDVLEYASTTVFPSTGVSGKIYVALDTNLTYRWSGTTYVEISPSLALGETSSTAYRGDRGKTAYDHSQSTHARTDATNVAASTTNGNIKINGTETTVYSLPTATASVLGGIKVGTGLGISSGVLSVSYGNTATTACAGNDSRLSDARTPVAHASTGTGYGVGTTANYGHVKLATGDMNGASGADGVACGKNHTHSQYAVAANLGTASTHAHGDYVTSIGTSGNTLTWSKGGTAQTAITVPYATTAGGVAWANVSSKPDTATRWPSWEEVTGKPNDYARSSNMSFTSGSEFVKVSDNGSWNGQVYSKQGYKECRVTYKIGQTNAYIMVGLNSDPTTDANYASIDYCWYTQANGSLNIYESGSPISSISGHTTYTTGDELIVEYSNGVVRYYHNGVLCRSVDRTYGTPLYFDSSFYTVSGKVYDVYFGPIHNDSSVSLSGSTLTVRINGVEKSLTNTNTTYSAGTGLSLSGTTFNHSNSVTAQTTQAVYPIKIDAQGHISAYGSAINYAGSSSAGGAATSANKLNTDAGSATNPVYFSGGVPVACTYSLNKTVPSDAVFTDHTYNFSGTTFYSGNSSNAEHNANNAVKNGNYYYSSNGPATSLGASTNDGALYVQSYSDSWVGQIAQDYRNGRLFVRGKNNGTWQNWLRVALYSEIPTNNNQLTNGAGYITSAGSCAYATSAGDADTLDGQHGSYYQPKVSAKGSTTKPVYTSAAGTFAECSTYAGGTAVTLNGTSKAASTASFYAPTSAGTSGQILKSTAGTPEWINQSAITAGALTTVSKTAWGQTFWTSGGVPTSISGNMTGVGSITASGDVHTTASVIGDKGVSSKGIANLSVAAISGSNFVTQVKIGSTAYNPSDGVVSLPAYPTVPTALSGFTNDVGYISGTVAVANGGTGATTASAARSNLGLGSVATLNTGSDTTKFLRNDGSWAVPAYPTVPTFSSLTLSTTAQKYDGTHTLALPASDPYTSARTPASHTHGNIQNGGTLNDTAAAAAGNDYVVIRDADNNKIQTSTIKGTDVADAVSKKHSHSSLTLSTTAQAYDGTNTLKLPASDPYSSARTPSAHATNSTTYGAGTTTNYGHVRLVTGDMNGASHADGDACSKNHTHSQYLTSHQSVVNGGNTASWGASVTVGTVGGTALTFTMPANPNTDTKNTTGADNTTSKIYLVGPTAQTSSNGNARTYSNSECYASGGYIYSKGKIVANRMETPQPQSGSATITLNGTEVPSYQMFDINSTSYLTKTLNHPSSYSAQSGFSYILISNSTSSEATINMPSGCIAPASSFKIGAGKSVEVSYFYNGNNVAVIMWSTALQAIS